MPNHEDPKNETLNESKNEPQKEPEEVLLHCRIFDIIKKYQIGRSGKKHERFVVRHPGGVAILPVLSDDEVVLIRQYRSAIDRFVYELPAGTREPGEEIQRTAERELIEETGFRAERWTFLTSFWSSPGILSEKIYIYRADGLTVGKSALEDGEILKPCILRRDEITRLIQSGEIADGKTLVGLLAWLGGVLPG